MSNLLAKCLHEQASDIWADNRDDRERMEKCGWWQFIRYDRPETDEPAWMAARAVAYLGLDGEGHWKNEQAIVRVALSFMERMTGNKTDDDTLRELGAILRSPPVDDRGLYEWFCRAFH